ncbi:MAG TPA: hypothetical protein VMA73_31945 [Streptosporangiaceae bacterium]|nr:hypothetical protein [Streptosporangiaceae bacterium]
MRTVLEAERAIPPTARRNPDVFVQASKGGKVSDTAIDPRSGP